MQKKREINKIPSGHRLVHLKGMYASCDTRSSFVRAEDWCNKLPREGWEWRERLWWKKGHDWSWEDLEIHCTGRKKKKKKAKVLFVCEWSHAHSHSAALELKCCAMQWVWRWRHVPEEGCVCAMSRGEVCDSSSVPLSHQVVLFQVEL